MARTNKQPTSRVKHYANSFFQLLIILAIAFVIRTFLYGLYQVPSGSMETTMLVGERFLADKLTIWFKKPQRGEIISFNDPATFKYAENPVKNWFQRYVWGPSNWTKRVIGIPGDHVQGKIENGKPAVYLNGKKLDEPYLNKYPLIATFRGDAGSQLDIEQGGAHFDFRSFDPKLPLKEQPFYAVNADKLVLYEGKPVIRWPGTPLQGGEDEFDVMLGDNEYWVMGDNRLGSWDSRGWGKLNGQLIHGRIVFRLWSSDSSEDWWIMDLIKHPVEFFKRMRWNRFFQTIK